MLYGHGLVQRLIAALLKHVCDREITLRLQGAEGVSKRNDRKCESRNLHPSVQSCRILH